MTATRTVAPESIIDAVAEHGSIVAAARALGVSPALLHYYIKRYGLEVVHEQRSVTTVRMKIK